MNIMSFITGTAFDNTLLTFCVSHMLDKVNGLGGAVRFLVVGTIGKEERPPRGQLWMVQYLISLKYWPILYTI